MSARDDAALQQDLYAAAAEHAAISLISLDEQLRVRHAQGAPAARGDPFCDLVSEPDRDEARACLQRVLRTRQADLAPEHRDWRLRATADGGAMVAQVSVMPSTLGPGLVLAIVDVTAQAAAERRRLLLEAAAAGIGTSLDVRRTAQELADVFTAAGAADGVEGFCDCSAVSGALEILRGASIPRRAGGGELQLRRLALSPPDTVWPEGYLQPGEILPRFAPSRIVEDFQAGRPSLIVGRREISAEVHHDPEQVQRFILGAPDEDMTLLMVPMQIGDQLVGNAELWWHGRREVSPADVRAVAGVVSRGGINLDLARRYTRERTTSLTLQRSLLPQQAPQDAGLDVASRYLPAAGAAGLGGDWFDVIPLSGARVALVVGDVVGHGVHASATMGRLRTAVRTLADVDLPPDELMTHLDERVIEIAAEHPETEGVSPVGTTCCVAVWDRVRHRLAVTTAGHLPPIVVRPDGTAVQLAVSPGPPLGLGWLPFEATEVNLPPDSALLLCSDGLVHDRRRPDLAAGLAALQAAVTGLMPGDPLDPLADRLMRGAEGSEDDVMLLLARLRAVPDDHTACWTMPTREDEVGPARRHAQDCLADWGAGGDLEEAVTLVVSELVTNALRYGTGPIRLRLIHDDAGVAEGVIVEVADESSTAPHRRHARVVDEHGRGLMIVASVVGGSGGWGARFGRRGKTVWARIPWTPPPITAVTLDPEDLDLGDLDLAGPETSL